jgi:hypothetical protein
MANKGEKEKQFLEQARAFFQQNLIRVNLDDTTQVFLRRAIFVPALV